MHTVSFTLTALVALAAVRAAPQAQPSNAPTCAYVCPAQDKDGYSLGNHSERNGSLFCSYPSPGGDPNEFFCKYSRTGGKLTSDRDSGYCPSTAAYDCGRNVVRRKPAPPVAAPVARAPSPEEAEVGALL